MRTAHVRCRSQVQSALEQLDCQYSITLSVACCQQCRGSILIAGSLLAAPAALAMRTQYAAVVLMDTCSHNDTCHITTALAANYMQATDAVYVENAPADASTGTATQDKTKQWCSLYQGTITRMPYRQSNRRLAAAGNRETYIMVRHCLHVRVCMPCQEAACSTKECNE
jgi:hypothetical protein